MANLDRNFLARPDFVVSTGEGGKTITISLIPKIRVEGDTTQAEPLQYYISGWGSLNLPLLGCGGIMELMQVYGATQDVDTIGVYNVTPAVALKDINRFFSVMPEFNNPLFNNTYIFYKWAATHPFHINALNLRFQYEITMPQQIIVKTPNIFTGQLDRQVIDVASKKTAYQYQNGIVTINNCDLFITPLSIIEFAGDCDFFIGEEITLDNVVGIAQVDMTIDYYIAQEKALIENVRQIKEQ